MHHDTGVVKAAGQRQVVLQLDGTSEDTVVVDARAITKSPQRGSQIFAHEAGLFAGNGVGDADQVSPATDNIGRSARAVDNIVDRDGILLRL
jgi:hypothetical protein